MYTLGVMWRPELYVYEGKKIWMVCNVRVTIAIWVVLPYRFGPWKTVEFLGACGSALSNTNIYLYMRQIVVWAEAVSIFVLKKNLMEVFQTTAKYPQNHIMKNFAFINICSRVDTWDVMWWSHIYVNIKHVLFFPRCDVFQYRHTQDKYYCAIDEE